MSYLKIISGFFLTGIIFVILVFLRPKNTNVQFEDTSLSPTMAFNIINSQQSEQNEDMKNVTKLQIKDLKKGSGDEAVSGKKITVHYAGSLVDGTKFDSSYDRGTPFTFNLGAGEVIKGWDMGFAGMKVGGKRKLTIPSELGYGSRGAGDAIPPDSTLIFEVELLEVE